MKEIDLTTTTETIYIGLKDANENKLYLGDIVKRNGYNRREEEWIKIELIVYVYDGFALLTYNELESRILITALPYFSTQNRICNKLIKIGNLRNNPELLKKEILNDIASNLSDYNTGV